MSDHTPTRLDAYVRKNPLQWKRWPTNNGGTVLAIMGYKYFTGECADCDRKVYVVRQHLDKGKTRRPGRWPTYCRACGKERDREHNRKGTERQRERRARLRAKRDAELARRGLQPPGPGRPRREL